MLNIVVVVQARTGSTRLPEKILKPILGKSVLYRQMERILAAKTPTHVIAATTTSPDDDRIVEICQKEKFEYYRGHPTDLLDRHYKVALQMQADVVIKIPSDCPLIDPRIIDRVIKYYIDNREKYDYVSNLHPATYPDGNDVEVMPFHVLKRTWEEAEKRFELEHTTPYIWDNPHKFRIGNVVWETGKDLSMSHRFTIDYQEDYKFINTVYEELYPENPGFSLEDILELLDRHSEIYSINSQYAGVNWYRENIDDLKTISRKHTKFAPEEAK